MPGHRPVPRLSRRSEPPAGEPPAEPPAPSALSAALALVGDRWSLLVVDALLAGPRRFGELEATVPGIATNVLTQRLRHLTSVRVILARPYSQRPLRSTYELTATGRELAGALRLLTQWGSDTQPGARGASTHRVCGTPLQARWWCPTCDQTVDEPDDGSMIWA